MACPTGKIPHFSFESAQRTLDDLKRRNYGARKRVRQLSAYRCPRCGNFHIGHDRKRKPGHAA